MRNDKAGHTSFVLHDKTLFRVDMDPTLELPKPFTPLFFTTNFMPGRLFGDVRTCLGTFQKFFIDGALGHGTPQRLEGFFFNDDKGKIVFECNPFKIFRHPIRATLLRSYFQSAIDGAPVSLYFSYVHSRFFFFFFFTRSDQFIKKRLK